MPHIAKYLSVFSLLLMISCTSNYRLTEKEDVNSVWIKSPMDLTFKAQTAYPQGGGLIHVDADYYQLEIKGDTVNFHFPYYGRAFLLDPNDPGYNIEHGTLTNLSFTRNPKKESIRISFDVKKDGRTYLFYLEFWENGSAYLDLGMMQRTKMSYEGYLKK